MKLCNDVITVFNARYVSNNDSDVYLSTVISGVSWHDDIASSVDSSGLKAADKYVIRIPADADFGGKSYVDPIAFKTSDAARTFTLNIGDIIVKGNVSMANPRPSLLQKAYTEVATVLAVTDNRRAPHSPHWKVVGK